MADKTTNYGLTKPTLEDFYDVNVQNANMDIIDEELKKKYDPNNKPKPDDIGAAPKSHQHTKSEITDFPTSMTPSSHASTHKVGGADAISPADIGASPTGHKHTKAEITDFPTSMPPTAHNHDDRYYTESEIDAKLSALPVTGHTHSASDVTSGTFSTDRLPTIPVAKGGTGATDAATARTNLGITLDNIGAAAKSHGNHVPETGTPDSATFLRNDNTWQKVTPSNIGAVPANPVLLTSANDLNLITANGHYYWRTNNKPANAPTDTEASKLTAMRVWTEDGVTCFQEIANMYAGNTHSCVMRRTVDGGEGYPWEWVNPPMTVGVEYRTVERYDNEPVFVTLLSTGAVQKRTDYHGDISLTPAKIGAAASSHTHDAETDISGVLPISKGGTGSTSATAALTNLGAAKNVHKHGAADINSGTLSSDRLPVIPITKGGTGASDAETARTNLGVPAISHEQAASTITAGTFAGKVKAKGSSQNPDDLLLRNSALSSIDATPAYNGEICWMYE